MHRSLIVFVITALLISSCGCSALSRSQHVPPAGTNSGASGELTVFAASSLQDALNEVKQKFEQKYPSVVVRYNYGGSPQLRIQLENGAAADLFASANMVEMEKAQAQKLVQGSPAVFTKNKLVVVLPRQNPGKINSLNDLATPGVKLVTTTPDVPVGAYTRSVLKKMSSDPQYSPGFSERVLANVVSEETNVRQVLAKVLLGEADAGVVYQSDITAKNSAELLTLEIPDRFNEIAVYPIAVTAAARNKAAADLYIEYLLGSDGQQILRSHSFAGK